MTTPHNDIVHGGWWRSLAGMGLASWSWLAGEASGLTILLSIATLVLTIIKIVDALRRWGATSGLPVAERVRAATRPTPLED